MTINELTNDNITYLPYKKIKKCKVCGVTYGVDYNENGKCPLCCSFMRIKNATPERTRKLREGIKQENSETIKK